ncbi:hypothetical protein RB199_28095 [Streptomyces libani]
MNPLNGPVEVAMRALVLLANSHPEPIDLSMLTVLDHAMLHSGQFHGPPSLYPHLPAQPGELGLRRRLLHEGLAVLTRSGLAERREHRPGLRLPSHQPRLRLRRHPGGPLRRSASGPGALGGLGVRASYRRPPSHA